MPFTEDLSVFTDPAGFGSQAQYAPAGETVDPDADPVDGIFSAAAAQAFSDIAVDGVRPEFQCALASVPDCTAGATFVINGTTYRAAANPRPDESGVWVVIPLQQVL